MQKIISGIVFLTISSILMSCDRPSTAGINDDSPTEAYKRLYAAVKAKDPEAIKAVMTKGSLDFAKSNAARKNQSIDQIVENGFTATTFSPTLPQIRDERIQGDMGAVEVYDSKDKRWEDLPFIKEDGTWKLAIGEMWFNTFKSPGKSQSQKENEAANAVSNTMIPMNINANANFKGVHLTPKPATNMQ